MNPYSQFVITDGTTLDSGHRNEVSLLRLDNGLCISDWSMRVAEPKNGGVWADSSLSDGRFLKISKLANVQETLTLTISDFTADALADDLHRLYSLLEKARNWGPSGWSREPVWIEAVGVNETNIRYSLVHDYRTPGAGNPFQQPFWQDVLRSSINDFELVLEREPAWRGNYPGGADCVEISAAQEAPLIYPLVFDGNESLIDLGSPAGLDDLHAGPLTIEAWINPDTWGSTNVGQIATKGGWNAVGWEFWISNTLGLAARCNYATDAYSISGTDEFGSDKLTDGWHHVAFVYNHAVDRKIYLWIDGVPVSSYGSQIASVGVIDSDAAETMYIGSLGPPAGGVGDFDGEIGWVRVATSVLYATGISFTPPERCLLPSSTGATWMGIYEGYGATVHDMSVNSNDGTATTTSWGDACYTVVGTYDPVNAELEESCDAEFAYIANKHNTVGLTHIFVEDGGVFGANLLTGDPPYSLLPAIPAANDRVYFGIDSTLLDAGPFSSLVFDLSQAQANIADIAWEYWNGAWVALTVQDNTDASGLMTGAAFDTLGTGSVHWNQPSDWATTAINGITALWVRAEVQDAGTQPPIQQTRHVYTILWPFIEIQKDQLNGNATALARICLRNQSDNNAALRLYYNRVLCGLRSVDRGAYFSPYLHMSDKQHFVSLATSSDVYNLPTGTGSIVADATAPVGESLLLTAPAALAIVNGIVLHGDAVNQYQGSFHLYARGYQKTGAAGDVSIRVWISTLTYGVSPDIDEAFFVSDLRQFDTTDDWQLLDFGSINIDTNYGGFTPSDVIFVVEASGNGSSNATLYDLIVLPTDEWATDSIDKANTLNTFAGSRNLATTARSQVVNMDNISDTRRPRVSVHSADETLRAIWQGIQPEGPFLLPKTRQRLWFCSTRYNSLSTMDQQSEPCVCGSVQVFANERYMLLRGDK